MALCDRADLAGVWVDRDAVQQGALLHDIGRSVTQAVDHGYLGAEILRQERWPEHIILAVERHVGAGIDAAEAAALGLPVKDYIPLTLEEKIVAHADNLYSGEKRLTFEELRAKYEAKNLPQAWARIEALHRELCALLNCDLDKVPAMKLPDPAAPPA